MCHQGNWWGKAPCVVEAGQGISLLGRHWVTAPPCCSFKKLIQGEARPLTLPF